MCFFLCQCAVCNSTLSHMRAGDSLWVYRKMVHCENCFDITRGKQRIPGKSTLFKVSSKNQQMLVTHQTKMYFLFQISGDAEIDLNIQPRKKQSKRSKHMDFVLWVLLCYWCFIAAISLNESLFSPSLYCNCHWHQVIAASICKHSCISLKNLFRCQKYCFNLGRGLCLCAIKAIQIVFVILFSHYVVIVVCLSVWLILSPKQVGGKVIKTSVYDELVSGQVRGAHALFPNYATRLCMQCKSDEQLSLC